MGSRIMKKTILFLVCLTITTSLFSQANIEGGERYSRKRNFSLSIGGLLYTPANLYSTVGSLEVENKVIPNYQLGIGYDIFKTQKTFLTFRFFTNPEPIYKFRLYIPKDELPSQSDHDLISDYKSYTMFSASIGLTAKRQILTNKYGCFTVMVGYALKYFPYGFAEFSLTTSTETSTKVLYEMYLDSPEESFHHSLQLGLGHDFIYRRNQIAIDIFYNYSFNYLMDGIYEYHNLNTSLPSYGRYKLSGNYFGLQMIYQRLW